MKIYKLLFVLTVFGFLGCSEDKDTTTKPVTEITSMRFINKTQDIFKSDVSLPLLMVNDAQKSALYTTANEHSLQWSISDPTIASCDQNGMLTALKCGTARLTVRTEDGSKNASMNVRVLQSNLLSAPLSNNLIFTKGTTLYTNSVMQSFDLCENNTTMYCSQVGAGAGSDGLNFNVFIVRKQPNTNCETVMTLPYTGHGNNIAV